jgi:hypothetical protein
MGTPLETFFFIYNWENLATSRAPVAWVNCTFLSHGWVLEVHNYLYSWTYKTSTHRKICLIKISQRKAFFFTITALTVYFFGYCWEFCKLCKIIIILIMMFPETSFYYRSILLYYNSIMSIVFGY